MPVLLPGFQGPHATTFTALDGSNRFYAKPHMVSTSTGWQAISQITTTSDLAEALEGNDSDKSKSIPEPLAHLEYVFSNINLTAADAAAMAPVNPTLYNEWLGMLCVLALAPVYGLTISSVTYPLTTGGIAEVLKGELAYPDTYRKFGWTQAPTDLTFFLVNNHPFAFYVPNLLICPMEEYNEARSDFRQALLPWYNANAWLDPIANLPAALVTAFKNWLTDPVYIAMAAAADAGSSAGTVLSAYTLSGMMIPAAPAAIPPLPACLTTPAVHVDTINRLENQILLVVTPDYYAESLNPYTGSHPAFQRYKIDFGVDTLTPKRIDLPYRRDGQTANVSAFVVPPVTAAAVNDLQNGTMTVSRFSAVLDAVNNKIHVEIDFNTNGMVVQSARDYPFSNVYITAQFPYVSLWPYVKADSQPWKEYFVSVLESEYNPSPWIVTGMLPDLCGAGMQKIENNFEIDLLTQPGDNRQNYNVEPHQITTVARNFPVFKTEKFPYAISIAWNGHNFGYWLFDDSKAETLPAPIAGKTMALSLDLGTTASQLRLSEYTVGAHAYNAKQITAPGEYIFDLFNPYYGKKEQWEELQTYYLYGSVSGPLPKIFSYQQRHDARTGDMDLNTVECYVSGRPLIINQDYLKALVNANLTANAYQAVEKDLKWIGNPDQFVNGTLTWGLLQARKESAERVQIVLSCPDPKRGSTVLQVITPLVQNLQNKYGVTPTGGGNAILPPVWQTEAFCNNLTFTVSREYTGSRPTPNQGFMVVDIGGGTTDISVWQLNAASPVAGAITPAMVNAGYLAGSSIRYAGREIINYSLLVSQNIGSLWNSPQNDPICTGLAVCNLPSVGDDPEIARRDVDVNKQIALQNYIFDNRELSSAVQAGNHPALKLIELKYISLFVFLGEYLRTKGLVFNQLFHVNLSGSGSKSLTLQGLLQYDFTTVIEMLGEALKVGYVDAPFEAADWAKSHADASALFNATLGQFLYLNPPAFSDKEEVAIGLGYVIGAAAMGLPGTGPLPPPPPGGAPAGGAPAGGAPAGGAPAGAGAYVPDVANLRQLYQRHLNKVYAAIGRVPTPSINIAGLKRYFCSDPTDPITPAFANMLNNLPNNLANPADPNNSYADPDLLDMFFPLYAFEALLDQFPPNNL